MTMPAEDEEQEFTPEDPVEDISSAAIQDVRARGVGPAEANAAVQSSGTTPALALQGPRNEVRRPPNVSQRAPVAAKHIAENPVVAASVGAKDEYLEHFTQLEEAIAGKLTQNQEHEEKVAAQFSEDVAKSPVKAFARKIWDQGLFRGVLENRRSDAAWDILMGRGDKRPDQPVSDFLDRHLGTSLGVKSPNEELQEANDALEKLEREHGKPGAVTGALGMAFPLAANLGRGGAPVVLAKTALATAGVGTGGLLTPTLIAAGMALDGGRQAAGNAFLRFREVRDASGNPVDPDLARGAALAVGALNAVIQWGGEAAVMKAFGPLIAKVGGVKPLTEHMEQYLIKAMNTPAMRAPLLEIAKDVGKATGKTAGAGAGFAALSSFIEDQFENDVKRLSGSAEPEKPLREMVVDAARAGGDAALSFAVLGGAPALVTGGVAARKTAKAYYFEKARTAYETLAQSEAGKGGNLRDAVSDMERTHVEDPDLHGRAVKIEPLRLLQKEKNWTLHPDIEERIGQAEKAGQDEVVIPTGDYVSKILNQDGADRLAPHERVADLLTPDEREKVAALIEKEQEDPVEKDRRRVSDHISKQLENSGFAPQQARVYGDMVANVMRVGLVDRAIAIRDEGMEGIREAEARAEQSLKAKIGELRELEKASKDDLVLAEGPRKESGSKVVARKEGEFDLALKDLNDLAARYQREGKPELAAMAQHSAMKVERALAVKQGKKVGPMPKAPKPPKLERAPNPSLNPRLWEAYKLKPLMVAGGEENARIALNKRLDKIAKDQAREGRKSPAERATEEAEAKAKAAERGEAYTPATPTERVQEAIKKTLGEVFIAYRPKGSAATEAYLTREGALKATKEATGGLLEMKLSPEDVLDAGQDGVLKLSEDLNRESRPEKLGVKPGEEGFSEGRGFIEDMGRFFKVTLSGKADRSTFLHEAAHFLHFRLEELFPKGLVELDKWLGREPGKKLTEEQMERFAQGLEQFIMEGKAPSRELAPMFVQMSRWMNGVYGPLEKWGVPLDADARRVFDRMFALQEEIDFTGKVLGIDPEMFREGDALSSEERISWRQDDEKLMGDSAQKGFKEQGRWGKEPMQRELNVMRAEAALAVNTDPLNNIYAWLKDGGRLDGKLMEDVQGRPLEAVGLEAEAVRQLGYDPHDPALKPLIADDSKAGRHLIGYDPEFLASALGIHDGQLLLEQLSNVNPNFSEMANKFAEKAFGEKYPGWSGSRDAMKAEAMLAVNDAQNDWYWRNRQKVIGNRLGKMEVDLDRARAGAEQAVRDLMKNRLRSDLKPGVAFRAEAQHIQNMYKAIAKGDWEAAWNHSVLADINRRLFRTLTEAKSEFDGRVTDAKKLGSDLSERASLAKDHPEYLTIADYFLEAIGLRDNKVPVDVVAVRDAVQQLVDRDEPIFWDRKWEAANFFHDYREMNVHDVLDILDAVDTLKHLAKQRGEVVIEGKRREVAQVAGELAANIRENYKGKPAEDISLANQPNTPWRKIRNARISLLKPEHLISLLDGGRIDGPLGRMFKQPMYDAVFKREALLKVASEHLGKLMDARGRGAPEGVDAFRKRNARIIIIGNQKMTVEEALSVLGYWGDARNREILLRGWGTDYETAKGQIEQHIKDGNITASDVEFINRVKKEILNPLWPQLQETARKESGLAPEKVPGAEDIFLDKNGKEIKLDGGYWFTIYDKAGLDVNPDLGSLFHPEARQAGIASGMVKKRSDSGLPMKLKLGMEHLGRHLNHAINYITMYDALTNAKRVLEDPQMARAIKEARGTEAYDSLREYVKTLARSQGIAVPPGMAEWNGINRWLRGAATTKFLAWKFFTPLQNIPEFFASLETVGPSAIAQSLRDFVTMDGTGSFRKWWDGFNDSNVSNEIKDLGHMKHFIDPRGVLERKVEDWAQMNPALRGAKWMRQAAVDYGMMFIQLTQGFSNRITHRGAEYHFTEKVKNGEYKGIELGTPEADKLIRDLADATVRRIHGSHDLKDQSPFFRNTNTLMGNFAIVAGYMNNLYGHLEHQGYYLTHGQKLKAFRNMAAMFIISAITQNVLRGTFGSSDEAHDDLPLSDPENMKWMALNQLRGVGENYFQAITGVGPIMQWGINTAATSADPSLKNRLNLYSGPPGMLPALGQDYSGTMEHVGQLVGHLANGSDRWLEDAHDVGHDLLKATYLFGLPGEALNNNVKFWERLKHGDIPINDAMDTPTWENMGRVYMGWKSNRHPKD